MGLKDVIDAVNTALPVTWEKLVGADLLAERGDGGDEIEGRADRALGVVLAAVAVYVLPKLPRLSSLVFDFLDAKIGHVQNEYAHGVLQRVSGMLRAQALKMENTAIEDLGSLPSSCAIDHAGARAISV